MMAGVPEEIRAVERPKNTIVQASVNKHGEARYLVRSRKGSTYKDGRSSPVNGGVVGYIIDGRFVPRDEPHPIEPDEVDMRTWAFERVSVNITKDILDDLRAFYDEKDAEMIYTMALLRARSPGLRDSRMNRDYIESDVSVMFPSLPMSRNSISLFLQTIGKAGGRIQGFLKARVSRLLPGTRVAVDGTLIQDDSEVNNLSNLSRKSKVRGSKDLSTLYAYSIDDLEPVTYCVYPGNVLDSKAYSDFIDMNDLDNVILVGDKAFTLNAAREAIADHRGLRFLFPIRRNSNAIARLDLLKYDNSLTTYEGVSYRVAHDTESNLWYYSFRDADRAAKEEKDFLASARKSNKGLNSDEMSKRMQRFGTLILESDLEMTPEQVYGIYKDRWLIEELFRLFKNIEDMDDTRVQSDYSVLGTQFINFISTVITTRLIRHVDSKGLLNKYCFGEVLTILSKTLKLRGPDGEWIYRALIDREKDVLRDLDLIPKLKPKRGPGRPPKNRPA